jgi:basic membrane lipoprotein Med (substrate-binding protein (PBP1-ABC) superfamily)
VVFDAQEQVLPQAIIDHVDELRQQIIDGDLKVEIYQP